MDKAIEFGTDGWRDTLEAFTTPRLEMVAQAVADYLREEADRASDTIAVGYDARETSPDFAGAVADVLAKNGYDVLLPERDCPTPVTAWTIVDRDLAGAMVITASHNPPEYNGVKFIPEDGAPALPDVTEALEARIREPDPLAESEHGEIREVDFIERYFEYVLEFLDPDLSGVEVVYDAMHGSGRGVTDALLERAGATVTRQHCDTDPTFGGSPPEPSAENLEGLIEAVQATDADLGIANDGDADRIAVVTPERGFLDENLFFAAMYDYLLESDEGPAVRTVSTSFLIDRVAAAHDQTVREVPVGFKWIGQAMAEEDALIGGEESGGFSIRGHIREKDGVLVSVLAALATSQRPLDERVDDLLAEHGEIHQGRRNLDCPDAEKQRVVSEIGDRLPERVAAVAVDAVNDADGFKILLEDGSWLLVRPSGTEPKLRVYAEAPSPERVDELLSAGVDIVEPLI